MIRELVIFAPQNMIKDPPFTKLDMLSCRNLLIYFGAELQKKLLPVFHYSLKLETAWFSTRPQEDSLWSESSEKSKAIEKLLLKAVAQSK